jgi:hypothetical protein
MAGLHFSCGKWLGEDKSADSFFEIVGHDLSKFVSPEEMATWEDDFRTPYEIALKSQDQESHEFLLNPAMMRALRGPLERYRDALIQKLRLSGPDASVEELGKFPRSLSADERKLECVRDLIRGNKVCQRNNQAIKVYFV